MDTLPSVLADRGPIIAAVVTLLSIVFLGSRFLSGHANTNIPLVGSELGSAAKRRAAYSAQAKDLYQKGYEVFKDKVFRLTTTDGMATVQLASPRY